MEHKEQAGLWPCGWKLQNFNYLHNTLVLHPVHHVAKMHSFNHLLDWPELPDLPLQMHTRLQMTILETSEVHGHIWSLQEFRILLPHLSELNIQPLNLLILVCLQSRLPRLRSPTLEQTFGSVASDTGIKLLNIVSGNFKVGLRSCQKGSEPGSVGIFETFDLLPKTTSAPAKSESHELHPTPDRHPT